MPAPAAQTGAEARRARGGAGAGTGTGTSIPGSAPMQVTASSSSSSASSAATLRRGAYRYSIAPSPVRFPATASSSTSSSAASSRPSSYVDIDEGGVSPARSYGSRGGGGGGWGGRGGQGTSASGATSLPPPPLPGGGAYGAPASASSSSLSRLSSSNASLRSTTLPGYSSSSGLYASGSGAAGSKGSSTSSGASTTPASSAASASVAAFAPAARPPVDRARPPNAPNPLPSGSLVPPSPLGGPSTADPSGSNGTIRERTRSGGLATLRAILGVGTGRGGSGSSTPRTRAETSIGVSTPRSVEPTSQLPSRGTSPERRGSVPAPRSAQHSLGSSMQSQAPQTNDEDTRLHTVRARHHSTTALVAGSMPMSRPNSKVLTTFPFPHPSNPPSVASGLGFVLNSPRASFGNALTSSPGPSASPSAGGYSGGAAGPSRLGEGSLAASQAMQQRLRDDGAGHPGSSASSAEAEGRPKRLSFGGLGLGFGFGAKNKSRDQLVGTGTEFDAHDSASALPRDTGVQGASKGQQPYVRAAGALPNSGPLIISTSDAELASSASPEMPTPIDPHTRIVGGVEHGLPPGGVGINTVGHGSGGGARTSTGSSGRTKSMTTLAKLPLTIFVPTLEIDWGSLPFGLGESRRRAVEDEANTREAEAILANQVRLFEERRAATNTVVGAAIGETPLLTGGGVGAGAGENARTGLGTAGAASNDSRETAKSKALSGAAPSFDDVPVPNQLANYGAIAASAPPPVTRADFDQAAVLPQRKSLFSLLGLAKREEKRREALVGAGEDARADTGRRSSSEASDSRTPLLPPPPPPLSSTNFSGTAHQEQQQQSRRRERNVSISSITSDPLDPYGYRSLAGPALLPAHAEYSERRKIERRRAARRRKMRTWAVRAGLVLLVALVLWLAWMFLLEEGRRLGLGDGGEGASDPEGTRAAGVRSGTEVVRWRLSLSTTPASARS
ncbi:hypothetical protein V8E36_008921 [Tilletia maclaganii]